MDLWTAAEEGNIAELAANKHAGSDLDALSPAGHEATALIMPYPATALTMAVVGGHAEAAQWLLDNGANVDGLNGNGSTALSAAAFLGHAAVAKVLVDGGSDTTIRNFEGQSAADVARIDWQTTEDIAFRLELDVDRETVESGRAKILAMIE